MTKSQEEFEDRVRRVLDQAARELQVRQVAWRGPSAPTRKLVPPRLGSIVALAGVLVAVLIVAGALVGLRHQHHGQNAPPSGNPLPPAPAAAFEPHLSRRDSRYVATAWSATVTRDPACNGTHGQQLTNGSPSQLLTSTFAILRRPAASADRLRRLLRHGQYGPPPGNLPPGVKASKQELYLNQIREARTALGASFYVIPAGNATGQRGVPSRCTREQVATLTHQISHLPQHQRTQILAAQARWLAYLRYQALHPEGVCATFVPSGARELDLTDNLGCATLADFERWGVLADGEAFLDHGPVFWTVVPDGVAQVTLRFAPPEGGVTHPVTITARPVDNVVVAREPFRRNYSGFPSTIWLLAADGRMIKKTKVTPNMLTLCGYGC